MRFQIASGPAGAEGRLPSERESAMVFRLVVAAAVALAGCAPPSAPSDPLVAEPGALDFGAVASGEAGRAAVKLRNLSGARITVFELGIESDRAESRRAFTVETAIPFTLAPDE